MDGDDYVNFSGVCWATNDELRLVKYLLDTDRYDTNVLPTDDPDKPVTVEIGLLLNQIIDLVSRSVIISLFCKIGSNINFHFHSFDVSSFFRIQDERNQVLTTKVWASWVSSLIVKHLFPT